MACGSGGKFRARVMDLPRHWKRPSPMRFEYGTRGKPAVAYGSRAAMPDSLAVRNISWPATDQLPMLPPTCGNRLQRAAPWVRVSVWVAGESRITIWPFDAGGFAVG